VSAPRQPRRIRSRPEWVAYLPTGDAVADDTAEPFAKIVTIYCGPCMDQITAPSQVVLLWMYVFPNNSVWPVAPAVRTGYGNVAKSLVHGSELLSHGYAVGRTIGVRAPSRAGSGDTLEPCCLRSGHKLGRLKQSRLSDAVSAAIERGSWSLALYSGGHISELSEAIGASWRKSGLKGR
jgi:hypothetical protein